MKAFGWILTIVCVLIIIYNVATTRENERMINDHPFITIFSGGENLKPAYTFLPPYTGFEITVIAAGLIGIVIIINAKE